MNQSDITWIHWSILMWITVGKPDITLLLLMWCNWKYTVSQYDAFLPKRFKTEFSQDFGPNYWFTENTEDAETY